MKSCDPKGITPKSLSDQSTPALNRSLNGIWIRFDFRSTWPSPKHPHGGRCQCHCRILHEADEQASLQSYPGYPARAGNAKNRWNVSTMILRVIGLLSPAVSSTSTLWASLQYRSPKIHHRHSLEKTCGFGAVGTVGHSLHLTPFYWGPLVHWSIHVHSTGVVPQLNACFAVDSSSHPLHSWANCYGPPEIGGNRWCPWVAGVLVAYWWIDGFWWITVLVDHWLIIACLLQMFALHGKLSIVWASFYTINRGYKSKMRAILHQNPEISSRTNHSLLSWLGLNIAKVPCTVICSRPAPWPEATSQPDGGETWKPQKK